MTEPDLEAAVRAHDHVHDLRRRLADAHDRLTRSRAAAADAARVAGEEADDVERLQGLTWTAVGARLRGRRDEEVAREEAEAARARLDAGRAARQAESDAEEVARLDRELRAAGDTRAALEEVLAARHAWAVQHDRVHGPRLVAIDEENGHLAAQQQRLHADLESLGQAGGWLTAGTASAHRALGLSAGGGAGKLMPWREQYAVMDQAVTELEHAVSWVRRTGVEVPELGWALESLHFSDRQKVADVLIQGPSDLFGHPRLKAAVHHCGSANAHLRHLDQLLRAQHHEAGVRRDSLGDERVRLLAAGGSG